MGRAVPSGGHGGRAGHVVLRERRVAPAHVGAGGVRTPGRDGGATPHGEPPWPRAVSSLRPIRPTTFGILRSSGLLGLLYRRSDQPELEVGLPAEADARA